jgi:hypothetical protein
MVGPASARQTMAVQGGLHQRIRDAVGLPLEQAWLSISLTEDPRWV